MKKVFLTLFLLVFTIYYSQVSEFAKIDKIVGEKYRAIEKKYKKKFPEERQQEIAAVNKFRKESYKKAIDFIQKDDINIDFNSIPRDFTKEAEYETGMSGFRNLFSENFDASELEGGKGTIKCVVKFLINENGKVSNIIAEGSDFDFNQEALITFYKISEKGKWKPAEKDGVPVKSVFQMPLTMNFE
ncbi:energy transducer TonB [Cloacibacterium sp.]|uniref:energy transducer TonB n=1 Tax=Cloacibacterium sp. TaxID=1913682 RepID=UPI0039E4C799